MLSRIKRGGIAGNHVDEETGEEYWVSGIKKRGSNTHWVEPTSVKIGGDAHEEYERLLSLLRVSRIPLNAILIGLSCLRLTFPQKIPFH